MKRIYCPPEAITQRGNFRYLEELRLLARKNRANPTEAERIVWEVLLKNKPLGFKFTRQKPIGRFIVDFYCSCLLLAIEIDGSIHNIRKNYDLERDNYLEIRKIKTIRYRNDFVLKEAEAFKNDLIKKIQNRISDF